MMDILHVFIAISIAGCVLAGSPCPQFSSIRPCYCSFTQDEKTIITCFGLDNAEQLMAVTNGMKSMIVDRLMLLGSFHNSSVSDEGNYLDGEVNGGEKLPENWLSSSRVRVIEMQDMQISNCFLCNDPFTGQDDFLTSLTVTHSSLEGNLCSVCNTKTKSVSTRYLQKMKTLDEVNFSFNKIDGVSGYAFPATLEELKKIVLSHNQITKINDNAFSNLNRMKELDLSNNRLTTLSRKIFKQVDSNLEMFDFSWNSVQSLPEDLFNGLRSLKEIKMSNNHLEVLSATTFSRVPVLTEKIDVRGNFLVCNCSMSWITKKLSKSTKISGKCVAPRDVEFNDIKTSLTSFQGCPPS